MSQAGPRTIVIVGGVAGGASAATRARRTNERAHVILLEKDAHVSFANCGMPYYVGGEIADRKKLLVATPEFFARRFGIDVRTRHEAVEIDRGRKVVRVRRLDESTEYEQPYDTLVLAPGAVPLVPPAAATQAPNVFTLRNLADTDRIKAWLDHRQPRRAVVVGAGFIGLEMVEQLAHRGLQVSLVEMAPQVLTPLDPEMAHGVQETLERHGVEVVLGDALSELIREDGLVTRVRLASGRELAGDLFVLGLGVRPNTALAAKAGLALGASGGIAVNERLQTTDPEILAVGDAAELIHEVTGEPVCIPLAGPANRAGRLAGELAAGGEGRPAPRVLGTAIVRVFDTVAAVTGLTVKAARRRGQEVAAVVIPANHHAGYYPGAQAMLLKLVYNPKDGRVLGAQAVGGDGVDKRIDVIATAIHYGATVESLADLDLTYAPPFGSARDPVHVAAFAASNQRAGLVRVAAPDVDVEGLQVVDVRTAAEVAKGMLPGALHIPVDELRARLGELDPARETLVCCQAGLRGYLASRILTQHGFEDVRNLTGGMTVRRHVDASNPVPGEGAR